MNLKRLFELYGRFPFRTATALTLCEAARAFLDPCRRPTYAQTGEDRVIESYLNVNHAGFYVDVGCHHPFRGSNTLTLYSRGWSGIAIDGNADLIRLFQRRRPRDTAVCAVVSNKAGPVNFAIAKNQELSTISPDFEKDWIAQRGGVRERVPTNAVRLETILEQHGAPPRFDLLTIDVEGHDYEVLTSFDIDRFRPRLIVVEMHGFCPAKPHEDPVYQYLDRNGYGLRSYTVMNGLFLDQSDDA